MLCVICIVGDAVAIHHDFHQRQIFTSHAPDQGTKQRLSCIFLRTKQQFFKLVVLISVVFATNESAGFGKQNVISMTGNL